MFHTSTFHQVIKFTHNLHSELGDGNQMFLDMYLLAIGWTETAVIMSGILRGVVDLLLKSVAGDIIDKTTRDRRNFLAASALVVAASCLLVFFVNGNDIEDKILVYGVRSIESVALAFIGPVFNAIALSAFGPEMFDSIMVKKELVSHFGEVISRVLSAAISWIYYPNIELVFILPAIFAASATFFVRQIPKGNHLLGRGFHAEKETKTVDSGDIKDEKSKASPEAAGYLEVFTDKRIIAIIAADVFHVISEANVGLIFNETLADVGSYSSNSSYYNGGNNARMLQSYYSDGEFYEDEGSNEAVMSREAIPLLATAGTAAQLVMILGTWIVGYLTSRGVGRKPFYLLHLCAHPFRVILIMLCLYTNAGKGWLVSTEFIGGLTGALGIVNVFMRADICFGSGRLNVVDGFQATIRGIAATSSQYLLGIVLEQKGPMSALTISLAVGILPPIIGAIFVPETLGMREKDFKAEKEEERILKSISTYSEEDFQDNHIIEARTSPVKYVEMK